MSAPSFLRPFAIDHAPPPVEAGAGPSKSRILAHNAYFETILSLVPQEVFRKHTDDEDEERAAAKYKKVSCTSFSGRTTTALSLRWLFNTVSSGLVIHAGQ
jgi:hypothetical protein